MGTHYVVLENTVCDYTTIIIHSHMALFISSATKIMGGGGGGGGGVATSKLATPLGLDSPCDVDHHVPL